MRIYTFYHGRFGSEAWVWTDCRSGSLWVVIGGYALAMCWGKGSWRDDPWGSPKAKPSAK